MTHAEYVCVSYLSSPLKSFKQVVADASAAVEVCRVAADAPCLAAETVAHAWVFQ